MKILFVLALCFAAALARRRIVGGSNVSMPGKYPWQASLQYTSGSHTCGASLISTRWLTSAAHCVGAGTSSLQIVLGMHDRVARLEGDARVYSLSNIIRHPQYANDGSRGFPNDIAVIQLTTNAVLNSFTQVIAMADNGMDFTSANCAITGWGRVFGGSSLPDVLQEAPIDVLTQSECRSIYGSIIQGYHTCVYDRATAARGSCNGDSGGPLACEMNGQTYLVGATSFGVVNCPTAYPSVYATVGYFRNWIQQNTGV